MDFGPGPKPPQGKDDQPSRPKPGAAEGLDDPIAREVAELASWPGRSGERAAESLLLRGEGVIPYLVEVLVAEESAMQPGAAWVLGRVGQTEHVQVILRAAARRRNGSRAEAFFDAAYDLDAKRTTDWLFSFLTLKRPVFRAKATEFLADHVGPENHERVLRLLDAPKPGVRISGLRLLEPARIKDAEARLVQALSDISAEVSQTASILLAMQADDEVVARLNTLAVEGNARERAYAILALVEVARTRDANSFEPRTLSELAGRRGLLHPEKLSRGAAAVGLAYGALDSSDESLRTLLDRTVVDVLIDTIGGDHFRDYASLVEPVFSALRRLSGLDLPATAVAWARWWRTEREQFQARRPLGTFSEGDVPLASVTVEIVDADGRHRNMTFRSEDGVAGPGDLVLKRHVFQALVTSLEESGLFEAKAVSRPRADEHLLIVLSVMNQRRRMAVPASDDRYPLLRMRFDSLIESNLWQLYRDADQWQDAQAWWKANVEMMEQADPATRQVLLRAAIVHAFDDLPTETARSEALNLLEDLLHEDEASGGLSSTETRALVQAATTAVTFGGTEERAVRFALLQKASANVRRDLVVGRRLSSAATRIRALRRSTWHEPRHRSSAPSPVCGSRNGAAGALVHRAQAAKPATAAKVMNSGGYGRPRA